MIDLRCPFPPHQEILQHDLAIVIVLIAPLTLCGQGGNFALLIRTRRRTVL